MQKALNIAYYSGFIPKAKGRYNGLTQTAPLKLKEGISLLSPKENLLNMYHHKPTQYVPSTFLDQKGFGVFDPMEKGDPRKGNYDAFGVRWINPISAGGAPIPAPNEYVLTDITKWKEQVVFPDVNAVDWAAMAARDTAPFDRDKLVFDFSNGNGVFERLGALMGFEEALIAMSLEPEAVNDLFTAITDFKIKYLEKVALHYKPDTFTYFDDIATHRGLFISVEMYRTLIKPHHKRMFTAIREMGIIPVYHLCGIGESIIDDILDAGAEAWSSVQPTNDIVSILKNYGDRLALIGGYDTTGRPGHPNLDKEIYYREVRRCVETYGPYQGYAFAGYIMKPTLNPAEMLEGFMPMIEEMRRIRQEQLAALGASQE